MEWIDVTERLPEIPQRKKVGFVKVLMTNGKEIKIGRFSYLFRYVKGSHTDIEAYPLFHTFNKETVDGEVFKPTHWLYLPDLPKKNVSLMLKGLGKTCVSKFRGLR